MWTDNGRPGTASERPNLVLVVVDTVRGSDLVPSDRLPGIRDIAARGLRFGRAISPAPWTLPAHGSLFSGWLPHRHGLTGDAAVIDGRLRPVDDKITALSSRWLPVSLSEAGYDTFAASANPWITARMGWDRGFDRFVEVWRSRSPRFQVGDGRARGPRTKWLPDPAGRAVRHGGRLARAVLGSEDSGATAALQAFRSWASERSPRPWFAFFNLMEAHLPYLPPRPFGPDGPLRRLAASRLNARLTNEFVIRFNVRREELSADDLEFLGELYRAEIAYLDQRLADLATELERVPGDTVLVIVGDHGEHLGEHHLLGHQASVAHPLLWVPLVVSGPTDLVARGEIDEIVSTLRVWGTLRQLAGLRADGTTAFDPPGDEAVAWYESAYVEAAGARHVADMELADDPKAARALRTRSFAVYRGRHKLTRGSDGSTSLYDIDADPGETRDLAASSPELLRAFDDVWFPFEATPFDPAFPGTPQDPDEVEGLEEVERHLESLGYL
jgi:arylsulfatase A-like enzyme